MKLTVTALFAVLAVGNSVSRSGIDVASESDAQIPPSAVSPVVLCTGLSQDSTSVIFSLAESSLITLGLLDLTGKPLALIADGFYPSGNHTASVDMEGLRPGIYLIKLDTHNESVTGILVNLDLIF